MAWVEPDHNSLAAMIMGRTNYCTGFLLLCLDAIEPNVSSIAWQRCLSSADAPHVNHSRYSRHVGKAAAIGTILPVFLMHKLKTYNC